MISRSNSRPTSPHVGRGETSGQSQSRRGSGASDSSTSSGHSTPQSFSFDTDDESAREQASDDSRSPSPSPASSRRSSVDAKTALDQQAAGFAQDHYMGGHEAALNEIVDNQRANHVGTTGATAFSPSGQFSASAATIEPAHDPASGLVSRDRMLLNLSSNNSDAGSVGVVAGCLFGSYSHTDANGLSVSAFGGTNGPVSFLGASISEKVGATVLGASVMPIVTASSGTSILSVEDDKARVAFKSSRDAGLFLSGSASMGAGGLGVRLGLTARQEVKVIRSVPKQQAQKAQNRSLLERTIGALRHKAPLGVPSLSQPLGDKNDPSITPFAVGDEVQTALRGTVIGGLALIAGGIHIGANAAISGEVGFAVKRMPDNAEGQPILRVGVTPTRTQAANLAFDVPFLGVLDASVVRGELMRSVWEINLGTPAGQQAYQDMLKGRLPQAPLRIDAADLGTAESSIQVVQDAQLPEGVSLLMVEANKLDRRVSVGAAITAPGYVAAGKFGKIEWSNDRSDSTTTVATRTAGLERRERHAGWTYELLRAAGAHRSVHVLEERLVRTEGAASEAAEQERFQLSVELRYPKQTPKAKEKIAQYLNKHVLNGAPFANKRFFGTESRDALNVTVGRTLDPHEIERLIEVGEVEGSAHLQARLEAAGQDPISRYEVIRTARQRLAGQVLKEGVKALGRVHRTLGGDDEKLTFGLENTAGERLLRKANKYAVQYFEGLKDLRGLQLKEATQRRLSKVGALTQEIDSERQRLQEDPLLTRLMPDEERQERLRTLDEAAALSRQVLKLDDVSDAQARRLLSTLPKEDRERLKELQDDAQSQDASTNNTQGGIATAVSSS